MPVERALTAYRKERLNCAQSVLRAFQPHPKIRDEDVLEAKHHGGGRADQGLCGALHAALKLTDDPAGRQHLRDAFITEAGSDKCREIRRAGRIPCSECVRLSARLLVEAGGKGAT